VYIMRLVYSRPMVRIGDGGPGKRERTRSALLDAFWNIVDESGFQAATLENVARRAGMTRGAIYSNFPSRADLLMAAATRRGLQITRDFTATAPLDEQLRAFAEQLSATLPNAPGTQAWHAEMLVHIAREPGLKAHIAEAFGVMFQTMAAQLAAQYGDELAVSAESLALAIQSLAMGLVYQAILSPGAVSEAAVLDAFAVLARGSVHASARGADGFGAS
jgi:AcrR family transcriptional regulator